MRTRTVQTSSIGPSKPMPEAVNPAAASPSRQLPTNKPVNVFDPNFQPGFVGPGTDPVASPPPEPRARVVGVEAPTMRPLAEPVEAKQASTLGPQWVRTVLPSRMVPYALLPVPIREVFLRPLTISILSLLDAAHRNNSFTLMVDALDNCIDIDVRLLTPSDFFYLMYWVRDNSYPRRALTLTWTSQYNNENTTRVRLTKKPDDPAPWKEMKIDELHMTVDEYRVWFDKGITFPTVRDMELLRGGDVADTDVWRVELAQYVALEYEIGETYADYLPRKLARLEDMGLAAVGDINTFAAQTTHGVQEYLHVYDELFDPAMVVETKRETIADLKRAADNMLSRNPEALFADTLLGILARVEAELQSIETLEAQMVAGEVIEPEEEVITLDIVVMDFFPETQ